MLMSAARQTINAERILITQVRVAAAQARMLLRRGRHCDRTIRKSQFEPN
jgi:hypothetical protein